MKNWIDSQVSPQDIIINSSINLCRNFKKNKFTDKMKCEEARENVDIVFKILCDKAQDEEFKLIKLWEDENKSSKTYRDKHIISEELLKRKDRGAFIVNKNETLSVMINEEDNIRIQCIVDGLNLHDIYKYINKFDDYIEEDIAYAFHGDYGYLSASPSNIGTGMKATVAMHLPALTISQEIPNILNGLNRVGMTINGMYGERLKSDGNMYHISNQITLGVKEDEIIENLKGVVFNIASEEKKYREIFLAEHKYEVEDKIFRSYGILKNAKILKSKETLELLSYIRFGVELGLLDIDKKILNNILISSRTSLVMKNLQSGASSIEQNLERANIVKELLS